jgi:hypothetical protein
VKSVRVCRVCCEGLMFVDEGGRDEDREDREDRRGDGVGGVGGW